MAEKGDYSKLCVSGKYVEEVAVKVWEGIVRDNCKATNNRKYIQYMDVNKEYLRLTNDLAYIKNALILLHFKVDKDVIKELGIKGYKINISTSEKYAESLKACDVQSKSLNTRITMQKNLLARMHKEEVKSASNKSGGMQASLVRVGVELGINLPQDILLSNFNEHVNVLKERIAMARKRNAA